MRYFETLDEFVEWYNHKRPHMSLNLNELETPYQAFLRKLPPERFRLCVEVVRWREIILGNHIRRRLPKGIYSVSDGRIC